MVEAREGGKGWGWQVRLSQQVKDVDFNHKSHGNHERF